ncbi:hypothetical protein [Hyphomicrobium sp. DY-1]|uniref:hypothetical protein n=1 Tax=Hyphomicrobium sp. DY-1 TaxID=3075650 RepID=UPI0039C10935
MSRHKSPPSTLRILVACSPTYRNRRAIMEALGSIFIDTIEQQREYYYYACPAIAEILDDGMFNRSVFHELTPGAGAEEAKAKALKFAYIVVGGDDAFATKIVSDIGGPDTMLVRLT